MKMHITPECLKNKIENEGVEECAEAGLSASNGLLFADTDIEYHKNCHDCGRFLKRELWVPKNHSWKKHALCAECYSEYDPPEY